MKNMRITVAAACLAGLAAAWIGIAFGVKPFSGEHFALVIACALSWFLARLSSAMESRSC